MLRHLYMSWPRAPPLYRVPTHSPTSYCPPPSLESLTTAPPSLREVSTGRTTTSTLSTDTPPPPGGEVVSSLTATTTTIRVTTGVPGAAPLDNSSIIAPAAAAAADDEASIRLLTLLESGSSLCPLEDVSLTDPLCYVMPKHHATSTSDTSPSPSFAAGSNTTSTGSSNKKSLLTKTPAAGSKDPPLPPLELPEVTCVADDIDDFALMEMDGIDLDVLMNGLVDEEDEDVLEDDLDITEPHFEDEDVVEIYQNVEIEDEEDRLKNDLLSSVSCMQDDEYLALGYKKITEYPQHRSFELSSYRTLQMVHVELYTALGCPPARLLEDRNLLYNRPRGRRRFTKEELATAEGSDTDTASEGCSVSSSVDTCSRD